MNVNMDDIQKYGFENDMIIYDEEGNNGHWLPKRIKVSNNIIGEKSNTDKHSVQNSLRYHLRLWKMEDYRGI